MGDAPIGDFPQRPQMNAPPDPGVSSPRGAARRAWGGAWLHGAGALGGAAFAWLAWVSRSEPRVPLATLFACAGVAWVALGAGWVAARNVERRTLLAALWVWAVVFRIAGFLGAPVLEDDWARYLWDGRQFAMTGNPFADAPADHFADARVPAEFQRVLDEINHPQWPTIYAPGCQFAFLAAHAIAPARLWPLKLILISADLLALALLLRLTSPRNALLYAWCPLVVQETAFTAHPDVLWVAAIVAALHALARARPARAAVCVGLALGTKIFALLLAPFLLARVAWRHRLLAVGVAAAMYLPFWLRGSAGDFAGLRAMASGWQFNATVHAWLAMALGENVARPAGLAIFAALWLWLFRRWMRDTDTALPRGDLVLGAFFLLSPVVNPWYLVALAPFVALRPSAWGVGALAVVTLSYAHGLNIDEPTLAPYAQPAWVCPTEFFTVLLLAVAPWGRQWLPFSTKRN